MADAISLPSNWNFKEMLSHTFPGFFSTISIFMLVDYLSPYNLTSLAANNLTNLISFIGLFLIIGTIIGVIIDGIHHTFIEDDIFDNFKEIQNFKRPIKSRLNEACPHFGLNMTRHAFFPKIANNGDKAFDFDDKLDESYYRYSEFYSNIFISLIIFSLISPFYAFKILTLPWKICIPIGLASLAISCLCLVSSYTTYKAYLQAQCSLICGYMFKENKDNKCQIKCNAGEDSKAEFGIIFYSSIAIAYITPLLMMITLSDTVKKNFNILYTVSASFLLIIIIFAMYSYTKNYIVIKDKSRTIMEGLSESATGITIAFLTSLFACMIILALIYSPIGLSVTPEKLVLSENIKNNSTIKNPVDTIILKNLGDKTLTIDYQINGIDRNWLSIENSNGKDYLDPDESNYLRIKLISDNITAENSSPGFYQGAIALSCRDSGNYSEESLKIDVPISLNLTKK